MTLGRPGPKMQVRLPVPMTPVVFRTGMSVAMPMKIPVRMLVRMLVVGRMVMTVNRTKVGRILYACFAIPTSADIAHFRLPC